jgi:hypothetical protein
VQKKDEASNSLLGAPKSRPVDPTAMTPSHTSRPMSVTKSKKILFVEDLRTNYLSLSKIYYLFLYAFQRYI